MLKRSDFLRCYSGGKRHFTSHFLIFIVPTAADNWRVGFAVSRKVGGAVQRNRVKRLLRELFRIQQGLIPAGFDLVVVPKRSLDPDAITYPALEREMLPLLTGLYKKQGKPAPASA